MKTGNAILAVWMEPRPELEKEFNHWYDDEHVPERMALPGFLSARRYVSLNGSPKYIAIYELEDIGALSSDAYLKVRKDPTPLTKKVTGAVTSNIRREFEQVLSMGPPAGEAAPYTLFVQLETDPEHDQELNDWYNKEHLAALAAVPGVLGARRYRSKEGSPKYLAIYDYASPDIRESEAWHKAADTPWSVKVRPLFTKRDSHLAQLIKAV
jgi:hypothetical protein